jgi:hypothetical protein
MDLLCRFVAAVAANSVIGIILSELDLSRVGGSRLGNGILARLVETGATGGRSISTGILPSRCIWKK